jgi:hypothetical protein
MPTEAEGELVEATEREVGPGDGGPKHRPRGEWDRTLQRTFFEQMRALARAQKKDESWVVERFIGRYGAPPPAEWVEHAWGSL